MARHLLSANAVRGGGCLLAIVSLFCSPPGAAARPPTIPRFALAVRTDMRTTTGAPIDRLVRVDLRTQRWQSLRGPGAGGFLTDPALSADGTRLLVTRTEPESNQRVIGFRLTGRRLSRRRALTPGGTNAPGVVDPSYGSGAPAWSPTGDRFAFMAYPGVPPSAVWVGAANGSGRRQLVPDRSDRRHGEPAGPPVWSRNGIYYLVAPFAGETRFFGITDGGGAIYRASPQTGATHLVLGGYQAGLAISRSGRFLAFGRAGSLYVMDQRTRRVRRLTHGQEDFTPTWAPDGRTILYAHAGNTPGLATVELALLDLRTGRRTLLKRTLGSRLTQPVFIP